MPILLNEPMKKVLTVIILSAAACFSQTSLINTAYLEDNDVQLVISLYQQNYTLSQPVTIKAVLKNTGTEERTISVYPEPSLCLNFNVIDADRNMAEKKSDYKNPALTGWKDGLKNTREIKLYPGEEFSQTIDINNWYNMTNSGRYSIQASFLDVKRGKPVWSNPAYVNIKPNERIIAKLKIEDEIRQQEADTVMTPEGTVKFMLDAMGHKDWESFFKYWNFEKALANWAKYNDKYQTAIDNEGRQSAIDSFKKWYKSIPEISTLRTYKIQNIVFPPDPRNRIVYCYVQYSERFPLNRYLYAYSLQQKGNKWYLTGVDAFITKKNASKEESQDFDYTQVKIKKE
jgi:hypothetical protein